MQNVMPWYDNSTKPLAEKVQQAASYYQRSRGTLPNYCLVHPDMFDTEKKELDVDFEGTTIKVRSYRPVLPPNMWIGLEG